VTARTCLHAAGFPGVSTCEGSRKRNGRPALDEKVAGIAVRWEAVLMVDDWQNHPRDSEYTDSCP
jgi:hypothetical protein